MRPEVNSNRFEISLRCELTLLSAFTWLRTEWNSLRCKFHFGKIDRSEISNRSEFSMLTVNSHSEINIAESLILLTSAHVSCCYCLKNNQSCNICFTLIKRYHLHMCKRVLHFFGKLPQWNLYVNCHVNGTFQSGLSSLRVSCKRDLSLKWLIWDCLSSSLRA